jgi:hypothetical protein
VKLELRSPTEHYLAGLTLYEFEYWIYSWLGGRKKADIFWPWSKFGDLAILFAIDVAVAQLTFLCVVETQLENPQTKWRFLAG